MEKFPNILRMNELVKRVGLKKSTIYALIKKGQFPKPIALGLRGSGWVEDEVHDWVVARLEHRKLA